jgi:hypothetical protein
MLTKVLRVIKSPPTARSFRPLDRHAPCAVC